MPAPAWELLTLDFIASILPLLNQHWGAQALCCMITSEAEHMGMKADMGAPRKQGDKQPSPQWCAKGMLGGRRRGFEAR